MINRIERAWLPACQQECCGEYNRKGFRRKPEEELGRQGGTPNAEVIGVFFWEVRKGRGGLRACSILVPRAKGSHVSRFEEDRARPTIPAMISYDMAS